MSHHMDVFEGAIRHQQSMFNIKIVPLLRRALEGLLHAGHVIRVGSCEYPFDRGYHRWVVVEDAKGFLGPEEFSGGNMPAETARQT